MPPEKVGTNLCDNPPTHMNYIIIIIIIIHTNKV